MSERTQILFVDDEERVLNALRRHFLDEDYELHTAISAREGLRILEQTPVEVVVSDFRMPEMNGGEFLREVSHRWPDTVRIVLSGYADISAVISAINDGAIFKFVSKPWQEHELKDAILEALDKHRSTARMRELAEQALFAGERLLEYDREQNDAIRHRNLELELLIESLSVIRDGFMSAPVPILIISDGGEPIHINPAAEVLFPDAEENPAELASAAVLSELVATARHAFDKPETTPREYPPSRLNGRDWNVRISPWVNKSGLRGATVVLF
jgi:FixJ family two-component response regulator